MVERIVTEGRLPGDIPKGDVGESLPKEGVFEGRQVTVVADALSLIADAAEELTFEAAETVEKKVEERRVEKERPSELIQKIAKLQAMVPDLDKDKLATWLRRIGQNPPMSSRELMDSLREVFKEVSHQHLALELLEESSGENAELQALAREAKAALEAQSGPSIRAGRNVSTAASEYASRGLGETGELRDFYRETVLRYEGATETFRAVAERFPGQSLPEAVAFLIRAVGNDLHARGPSIEPEELRAILNDLYHLESLANLHQSCEQLLQRTRRGFGIASTLDPRELLGEFLTLKDKQWISESDVLAVVKKTGIEDPSARIYFLQGFLDFVRQAPLKLFPNSEGRLMLITKMQEALDRCIEEEA
ncbi:SepL/TyeA/HrpJ family type III secretion system gatekeeper [Thermodesulfomicrobium sp. WS]|uniref:type III secretion system gatekeeper subunit SctW n=1 Tax=Thermodesulfomicrobium sp. WS TaxID=3004129 RepID=UPI002492EF88|nr:type III secretion system gatekeeper subunit SctW [Thermodesulfomicrobium sp. WS]BDV01947.1 SepL/TyeA/HrpJ family type III secretion system gatekeeper [Thermodesulfomicrobium sp. WS]